MLLTEPCLIVLFLTFASGNSTTSQSNPGSHVLERPQEYSNKSSAFTEVVPVDNDNSDPYPDVTMAELLLFESLINEEQVTEENHKLNSKSDKDDMEATSTTPAESRIAPEDSSLRLRQGELNPDFEKKQQSSSVQFDDSKEGTNQKPPPRFGQRARAPKKAVEDGEPILQLTQGGYQRPYQQRTRFRSRPVIRPDSSEQSEKVEEPNRSSDEVRQPTMQRIVPQVTYSNQQPRETPNGLGPVYGPIPILQPAFQVPQQNLAPMSYNVPTPVHNGVLNPSPAGFLDFTSPAFRTQFPPSNDIGYPSFAGNPNNAALYQSSPRNPYQNSGLFFQGIPQMQAQPVLVDPSRGMQPQLQIDPTRNIQHPLQLNSARNLQSQLPPNSLPVYHNFDNAEDNSRDNYASYFSNPNIDPQFEVPANFYRTNPNEGINAFNNQPINFMANYPNADERYSTPFYRYPDAVSGTRNRQNVNRQSPSDQQPDSDTSQEEKKTQELESKELNALTNEGDRNSVPFGTRLPGQNEEDFYIRYPTNEAGYAVKENLPPQNGSEEAKDNTQRSLSERRNFPNIDPYRDSLSTVRNQRQNRTHHFIPEELFRSAPIDFGYQRPQNQIFVEYPNGNRDAPRYPTPDFDPRGPFSPITPLTQNGNPFLNAANQRRSHQSFDEAVPSCAKQNNASFCFEDNEYPKNDILYTINSNSYLLDGFTGPNNLQLDSFVDGNSSDTSGENYACSVDTKFGTPMRAKNLAGIWRIIINVGRFSQPVRIEVCKSTGDPCSYADTKTKTSCEQKFSIQRLLTWSPDRGPVVDVFKIPVACACRILQAPPA